MAKHRFLVTVDSDEEMGMDTAEQVRALLEEAISDAGIDNGCSVCVDILDEDS